MGKFWITKDSVRNVSLYLYRNWLDILYAQFLWYSTTGMKFPLDNCPRKYPYTVDYSTAAELQDLLLQ